jgi:hypothetical protein
VTVAVRAPVVVGLNSMELVQLAPAGRGLLQVEADLMKELAPDPVMVVDAVKETGEVPVLLRVINCTAEVEPTAVEGKVRLVGERVSLGEAAAPVPLRETVLGEPVALSV